MAPKRTPHGYPLTKRWVSVTGSLLVVVAAMVVRSSPPPPLADLIDASPDQFVNITLVFRPLDCKMDPGLIEELNALSTTSFAEVKGVVLQPPVGEGDRETVLREFAIQFPVYEDVDGEWGRALATLNQANPLLVVASNGRQIAAFTPRGLDMVRRYLPTSWRKLGKT